MGRTLPWDPHPPTTRHVRTQLRSLSRHPCMMPCMPMTVATWNVNGIRARQEYAREVRAAGKRLVLAGDLNVTRTDRDVHPKERKPGVIGQRPEERELFAGLLEQGLVDVGRQLDPDNDGLFTWWAPWRNMRQRNIGWRLDYVFASEALASRATSCVVQKDVGTSDHAPVITRFDA